MLQERRRVLHARIVDALETLGGDRLAEQVERLAHHALRGEVWDKAVTYFRQAGGKAMTQSAYWEAVLCYEQSLAALAHLLSTRETDEQAIDLWLDLRNVLMPLGEQERVLDLLQTAESLAERLDDSYRLGQITYLMSASLQVGGEYDRAVTCAHRAIDLSRAYGNMNVQVGAHINLARSCHNMGDYHQALKVIRQTLAMIEVKQSNAFIGLTPPPVAVRALSVQCHAELGAFADGMAIGEAGLRIAEFIENPFHLVPVCANVGFLCFRQGNADKGITMLERALVLCKATQNSFHFPWGASRLAAAYALAGRGVEALPLVRQTKEQVAASGRILQVTQVVRELGETLLLAGPLDDASALAEYAVALSQERQERGVQAHVLRLLGDIAMHRDSPDVDQAVAHYQQALVLANELGMRPLQAHCHRGLGTLYSQIGNADQARAELSTAIDMYRDMEMTFWLPETEEMLAKVERRV